MEQQAIKKWSVSSLDTFGVENVFKSVLKN